MDNRNNSKLKFKKLVFYLSIGFFIIFLGSYFLYHHNNLNYILNFFNDSKNLPSLILSSSIINNEDKIKLNLNLAPHIHLSNFFQTYGERLTADFIISREEWGANPKYSDLDFIKEFCLKNSCQAENFNIKDTIEDEAEKERIEKMILNYNNFFAQTHYVLRQTKTKENGLTYNYLPVEEIVIHHTAGHFTTNLQDSKKELDRIHLLQAVRRRWQDIGYHYLIDGSGRIYEGTLGGKYAVGAHVFYRNSKTLSIALMGDFRPNRDKLNDAMLNSLVKLIQFLSKEYNLDLFQEKYYLRKNDFFGREWIPSLIRTHKEVDIRTSPTKCPGINPDTLRKLIYEKLKN